MSNIIFSNEKFQFKINKVLREKKIANQIVKSWFGMEDGKMDLELIASRGQYNASEFDVAISSSDHRKNS